MRILRCIVLTVNPLGPAGLFEMLFPAIFRGSDVGRTFSARFAIARADSGATLAIDIGDDGEGDEAVRNNAKRPTIARIWRGRTRRDRADEYEAYNFEAGIRPLIEKALGVQSFREDRADETEFITISYWESVEAMSRFTGGDPARIHHLERDPEFLIELPKGVQILRVRTSHGNTGGDGV